MGRMMHAESPRFQRFSFSEEKTMQLVDMLLKNPSGGVFVAESDGYVIGMMAGFITQHFFSYETTASDFVLFVVPSYRGGSAALRLIKAFEEWAFESGAREITLGISTQGDTSRIAQLYQKLGYHDLGHTMIKGVQ
jgi:GNAT superfamily N-acetyltransferase